MQSRHLRRLASVIRSPRTHHARTKIMIGSVAQSSTERLAAMKVSPMRPTA